MFKEVHHQKDHIITNIKKILCSSAESIKSNIIWNAYSTHATYNKITKKHFPNLYTMYTRLTRKGLHICPLPADAHDSCFRWGAVREGANLLCSGGHTGGASGAVHQGPRPLGAHQRGPDSIFFLKLISSVSHVASHSGYCREIVF